MADILQIYISSFWAWAGITVGMITVLNLPLMAWRRWLRHRNIALHGWPTNQLMDADGHIIHPEKVEND